MEEVKELSKASSFKAWIALVDKITKKNDTEIINIRIKSWAFMADFMDIKVVIKFIVNS